MLAKDLVSLSIHVNKGHSNVQDEQIQKKMEGGWLVEVNIFVKIPRFLKFLFCFSSLFTNLVTTSERVSFLSL